LRLFLQFLPHVRLIKRESKGREFYPRSSEARVTMEG
jgi:hypothetical protein